MFVISGKHFQITQKVPDHYSFGKLIVCTYYFWHIELLLPCYFLPEIVFWKKALMNMIIFKNAYIMQLFCFVLYFQSSHLYM